MTAATADRETPLRKGELQELPVAANAKIFAGTAVASKTDGYCQAMANTAGLKFEGIAVRGVDNTGGADGAVKVLVRRTGVHELISSGLTVADIGKPMYFADDQTVQLTPTNVLAGLLARFNSATVAEVDIEPAVRDARGPRGKLFVIPFRWIGTVGTSEVTARDNWEQPGPFRVLRGFADAQTAPGSGYKCTVKFTDGTTPKTFDIDGTATHGEDKAINQVYSGDADIDVTLQDDNASAATADVDGGFICEEL